MKASDQATAELLAALVEIAIAHPGAGITARAANRWRRRSRCSSACGAKVSSPSRSRRPKSCPVGARARTIRAVPTRVRISGWCIAASAGVPPRRGRWRFWLILDPTCPALTYCSTSCRRRR